MSIFLTAFSILFQPRGFFLLLHLLVELSYSYIDKNLNNGFGDVVSKNNILHDSIRFMSKYLSAINHTNGRDWWILHPLELADGYLLMLLDENGFSQSRIQHIGPELHWNASASGTAVFSPDGTKFAYFNKDDNLFLFDFDRDLGVLSNFRSTTVIDNSATSGYLSSVEFSPDSRFIYIAVKEFLWQIDLDEQDLENGKELIAVWDGTNDPFATTFTLMALAPNCKIYICSGSSTNTYHVINKPNEKGSACDFVQRGVQLPHTSSLANMPNFPRFRVDDDEKCDPTITSVFGEDVHYRKDLSVFPNPAIGDIIVNIPEKIQGHLLIYDINGNSVQDPIEVINTKEMKLDLSDFPLGTYIIEFIPMDQSSKVIWNSKVVLIR